MQSDWLGDCFFNKYRARWMDRWAVSLSGPETAVNSPSQPFQALHAWEAATWVCMRGRRRRACMRARRARRARLARRARWFRAVVQGSESDAPPGQRAMQ